MRYIRMRIISILFLAYLASAEEEIFESASIDEDGLEPINLGQQEYFQGDVNIIAKRRNAILAAKRWPNAKIFYEIDAKYPPKYKTMLMKAMHTIETNTCIRFEPRVDEKDYVVIFNSSDGCYSEGVGRKGGRQKLSLMIGYKRTCFTNAILIHELLHVVGLWHEQMRYDRDDHINIHWENVAQYARGQFAMIPPTRSNHFDLPYDYKSVMHYDAYAFSIGKGKITMEPTDKKYLKVIGKAKTASDSDWVKVRQAYECDSR